MSSVIKICTHSGSFHADEALAIYMLRLLPKFKDSVLCRSRDPKQWESSNIVVDVGGKYDGVKFFDHHQREFNETFNNTFNTKLSSAGLVYKHFGREIINEIVEVNKNSVDLLYNKIYENFIEAIDANDNGISQYEESVKPKYKSFHLSLPSLISNLNPLWNESTTDEDFDRQFLIGSELIGESFVRVVKNYGLGWLPAKEIVQKAFDSRFDVHDSGKIIVLEHFCPWKDHLYTIENESGNPNEVLYVVFLDTSGKWRVSAVPVSSSSFDSRQALREEWRGLRDDVLSSKTGIPGCIFIHASGFIGGAESKDAALELAKKSLII